MKDILIHSSKKYANKNALGAIVKDGEKSIVKYKTYAEWIN